MAPNSSVVQSADVSRDSRSRHHAFDARHDRQSRGVVGADDVGARVDVNQLVAFEAKLETCRAVVAEFAPERDDQVGSIEQSDSLRRRGRAADRSPSRLDYPRGRCRVPTASSEPECLAMSRFVRVARRTRTRRRRGKTPADARVSNTVESSSSDSRPIEGAGSVAFDLPTS